MWHSFTTTERGLRNICKCGDTDYYTERDDYGYTTYFCSGCDEEIITFGPPGE